MEEQKYKVKDDGKKDDEKEERLEDFQGRLEKCKKLRDKYLAGWQRERADFKNYKKDEKERIEKMLMFVKADLIVKIIDVWDNFERARREYQENLLGTNDLEKTMEWIRGVLQTTKQIDRLLKEEGIEEIKAEGERFNPNFHEAVEEVEAEDKEAGIVIEVLQKGYLLKGQLLRPAKVKVAK